MNTPSHLIITAAIAESLPRQRVVMSAALLGAVAPDIPLYLLSLGSYLHQTQWLGTPPREAFEYMYSVQFYRDPLWILLHNLLHAPLVLMAGIALVWMACGSFTRLLTSWWGWFFLSCLLHTAIDIPTHFDDGPLIFFPFDWQTRFQSPVSYWDPQRFGLQFVLFEGVLDLVLLCYLLFLWARRWRLGRTKTKSQNDHSD